LIAAKQPGWRSAIHAAQWSATVKDYCEPIWNKPIDEIAVADVLRVLTPIWLRIPATGSRLRGRIEAILNYAKAKGWRSGENPAQWRGGLEHLLPRRQRLAKPHHAAMPYQDVPGFIATLRKRRDVPHLAIEFLILTAARSGEARCAQWSETDLDRETWTLPPARMKAGIAHTVPLSPRASEILREIRSLHGSLVFPGKHGRPIASTVLHKLLPPGVTLHGFRSSFADWAAEQTHYPREVCEQALAHTVGNATELAYRRTNLLERRRELMSAWAQFCEPVASTNVVSIAAGR
jgi:integrase